MESFEEFIVRHDGSDTSRLLLSLKEWPVSSDPLLAGIDASKLAVNTLEARKKLQKKAPSWHSLTSLVYPSVLSAEQCSSEATARYKAALAGRIVCEYAGVSVTSHGNGAGENSGISSFRVNSTVPESRTASAQWRGRIADLTGGLGVDDLEFSKTAGEVLYNEMNPELAAAAAHNFRSFGAENIRVVCSEATPASLKSLLGSFSPDLVFADPARRSAEGRKVFLLKDCSPNVLELAPEVFRHCRNLLLKLSPMADISLIIKELNEALLSSRQQMATPSTEQCGRSEVSSLPAYSEASETLEASGNPAGPHIREVHIVASDGECKEVLVWIDRDWRGEHSLCCSENGHILTFSPSELSSPEYEPATTLCEGGFLFEPGKSLTKAGAFRAVCRRFGLLKLGLNTHLYSLPEDCGEERLRELSGFGKVFGIDEVHTLCKASIKDVGRRFPHSEVTCRNIPIRSEELRARMKLKSGEDRHIFAARAELSSGVGNFLIVCRHIHKSS